MTWIVSIPAWGPMHVAKLLAHTLPSVRFALRVAGVKARILIHTDQGAHIVQAANGEDIDVAPVPGQGDLYQRFGDCHRDAIARAAEGDRVALLCADMAVSRELFSACEARFGDGKRAVVAAATRTLANEPPPIGASSYELLAWTMRWPHPMVRACFWGERSQTPWAVYFRNGDHITLRGFHLHPVAVVKDRALPFHGTLDIDLLDNYGRHEIHVVTSPDELSLAERSPPDRPFREMRFPMTAASIAEWASTRATPLHWWLSTHRIIVAGAGETDDQVVWDEVMAQPANPLLSAA